MLILEISFRDIEKTEAIENSIRKMAAKVDQVCSDLISCRVIVEKLQQHHRSGNSCRVRINISLPGNELVAICESSEGDMHDPLPKVLRDAFNATHHKLKEYVRRQRGEAKTHPDEQTIAFVISLVPKEGYGFLKTMDGREIYFNRNNILHNDFDCLEIGTGVQYMEMEGEKSIDASTLKIIDKSCYRISKFDKSEIESPLGWKG